MSLASDVNGSRIEGATQPLGLFWLAIAVLGAIVYFQTGLGGLLEAWSTPEYSHGPIIPVLSSFLFLRQLKRVPVQDGPVKDRIPGLLVMLLAVLVGFFGRAIQISDFVFYAIVVWVGGLLLLSFGWRTGRQFWPPVLHLVYMLPLPAVLYYGLSIYLQTVSSQLGVYFLRLLNVPVFLDGHVIDLGVYKLQVAEACSGLRYLFPILSFSYVFSVLYRGPLWHKAVLLISAVPITVLMNAVRIAIAGAVVNVYGLAFVEGLTHFMEGWVIFLTCIVILFLIARLMLLLHPERKTLVEALDLEMDGLWPQFTRLRFIRPSRPLIAIALVMAGGAIAWQIIPQRPLYDVQRTPFYAFPREFGGWNSGAPQRLDPATERILAANDYYSVELTKPGMAAPVDFFTAWYRDQMKGGTHSPTVCLPNSGWEIEQLTQIRSPKGTPGQPFTLNRARIRKGLQQMLVYYWYDQQGIDTASAYRAKLILALAKLRSGRADGALVRLITPILPGETEAVAESRLMAALKAVVVPLPRFIPGA